MAAMSRRMMLTTAGATLAAAGWPRNSRAQTLPPLNAVLQPVNPPAMAPDVAFVDAAGKSHHLSEFRGHGMVVNLWATWCAPCIAEMPSLAVLSKTLAPADIAVLPLSSDHGGAAAVEAFFREHDITGLPVLLDPQGAATRKFGAQGIPTSVIIDKSGQEVAMLSGSADWAAPAAAEIVRRLAG